MRWHEFELEQSALAELGRRRLGDPGVVLVGTIRRDGSTRISPVEPLFWHEDLWLSMGWGSRKAADLQRDARVLVHSIVTSREGTAGEYKVRGRAIAETDRAVQHGYARAIHAEGIVPLSDCAGEVVATGNAVTRFKRGDRVTGAYFPRWRDGSITRDLGDQRWRPRAVLRVARRGQRE